MGTKLRLIGSLGKAVLAGCLHSGDIFTALDELDQGKKLQAEQRAAKRSPGLDFEM